MKSANEPEPETQRRGRRERGRSSLATGSGGRIVGAAACVRSVAVTVLPRSGHGVTALVCACQAWLGPGGWPGSTACPAMSHRTRLNADTASVEFSSCSARTRSTSPTASSLLSTAYVVLDGALSLPQDPFLPNLRDWTMDYYR